MMSVLTGDPRLVHWAQVITEFCTEIKPRERVEISGEVEGAPLMLALYRHCLELGAFPVLKPVLPEASEVFYAHASSEQLSHVHPSAIFEAEHTDVSLHIAAESNTKALAGIEPEKISKVRLARQELSRIRKEHVRWNITSYPTDAYAQDAGMSRHEFAEFIFNAGFLNHDAPLTLWRQLRTRQQRITAALQGVTVFRLESAGSDLSLGVSNRRICESSGKVNMPDGEIYTGPVETAVDGFIHFSFPGYFMGQVVTGIRLEFKHGEVVNASADTNEKFLLQMLNTDAGARRIGELGIGTNWGIQRFTQNLLFDEKMGGTIHLALGDSYRETLGENRSAIHWDILHDLRVDGRILADQEVLMENGQFVGRFAEIWNE